MPTSNSVFFGLRAQADAQTGWTIRVRDPKTFNDTVAELNDWVSFTIGPQLNDSGAGSITLDLGSPFWRTTLPNGRPPTFVLDWECLWEAYEDGVLRFQWLGNSIEETQISEDGSMGVTVSGPGAAECLKWGLVLRPGFPIPVGKGKDPDTYVSGDPTVPAYKWGFSQKWPAMRMWLAVFQAAQSRGCFPWLSTMFNAFQDSGGAQWEYIPILLTEKQDSYQVEPGTTMREFLDNCTGQNPDENFAMWADWFVWPGFRLDVRKNIGNHRERDVIFFDGNVVTKTRTRVREDIRNFVIAADRYRSESVAVDWQGIYRWNRREAYDLHGNVTNVTRRNAVASILLAQQQEETSSWEVEVPADQPGRQPFRDYNVGDWIGIATHHPDGSNTVEAYRAMAITVEVDNNGYARAELTLQTVLQARQLDLQRQLTRYLNSVNNVTDDPLLSVVDKTTTGTGVLTKNTDGSYNWADAIGASGGIGGVGGVKVFIQDTDPGSAASVGDFWYLPTGQVQDPTNLFPVYTPDPEPAVKYGNDGFTYKPIST